MTTVSDTSAGCPVLGDIAHCPLYIESHNAGGLGCVDDMAQRCKVARGVIDFQSSIINLAARGIDHPGMMQLISVVGGVQ